MRLQPIIYTTDMNRSVAWYAGLLGIDPVYRSDVWTSFAVGDSHLALHRVEEPSDGSRVQLSLVATEPLEAVVDRLTGAGLRVTRGIQEETFGRSLVVEDPEGMSIQVNEHDSHD